MMKYDEDKMSTTMITMMMNTMITMMTTMITMMTMMMMMTLMSLTAFPGPVPSNWFEQVLQSNQPNILK